MNSEISRLSKLPKGWVWTNVSEVARLIRGVSYPKEESSKEAKDGYIPILRANNIDGELNFNELVYVPRKRVNDEQLVKVFDILIAMSSGSKDLVGKASQANHDFDGGFGAFCGLVRTTPELDRRFVGFFFKSLSYRSEISRLSSGVNINNLRRDHIESMPIPLPPLPEQHRIVAKIEELFTRLDAGVEALKKIKAQLKRYRQSVLRHAFEGKLTEKWRQTHKHELEPASVLLERIKQERKKDAKRKYEELPPLDTSDLSQLPEGWVWSRIGDICETTSGGTPSRRKMTYYGGNIPWLKSGELEDNVIKSVEEFITEEGLKNSSTKIIPKGSLLMALYGATVGKLGILAIDAAVNQAICAIFAPVQLDKKLLFWYLIKYRYELLAARRGGAQPNISQGIVNNIILPLSPLPEQKEIVSEIERRFSVADEIEEAVDHSLKQAERLRQSILKRAFAGKLVPQDPNEEPAEKLLERIKAEKAKRLSEDHSRRENRTRTAIKQMRLV